MTQDTNPSRMQRLAVTAGHTLRFSGRVLANFVKNKGLLLSGGVAYNALLSVVPLFAVVLVALTHFVDYQTVFDVIHRELTLIAPGQADDLVSELEHFYSNRHLIGGIGALILLFFSSLAFRMLEDAFAIIFADQAHKPVRSAWASALIPYAYIALITLSLLAITAISATLEALSNDDLKLLGTDWTLSDVSRVLIFSSGLLGEVILFASVFRVMPVISVTFRRAFVGGFVTTVLWEVTRGILSWYFTNLSLVSLIYGSFTTVVVVLLFMEVATIILLLGAQVIAELERSAYHGLPWHVAAPKKEEDAKS